MISLFVLSLFSFAINKVAIIDTGINYKYTQDLPICENGLIDLTRTGMKDNHGHGSNVSEIITRDTKDYDYCLVVFKYIDPSYTEDTFLTLKRALLYIFVDKDIKILNLSLGGKKEDPIEKFLLTELLEEGIIIVAAAGNDKQDLDKDCNFFPACYDDRIIKVGNYEVEGIPSKSSNYGKKINRWYKGTRIAAGGIILSGTSQSTAAITAEEIKRRFNKRKGKGYVKTTR